MFVEEINELPNLGKTPLNTLVTVLDGCKTFQIHQCLQKKLQNSPRFNHQSNMKRLSIMAS